MNFYYDNRSVKTLMAVDPALVKKALVIMAERTAIPSNQADGIGFNHYDKEQGLKWVIQMASGKRLKKQQIVEARTMLEKYACQIADEMNQMVSMTISQRYQQILKPFKSRL